ncbi:MAG: hypothetical protein M1365_16725 [Actinobacteria bacterium]|nr:hypothetical protein [Actinomycetota bacterium]
MPTFAPSSNPNIKRFISKKNCITFTYEEKQDIETAAVSEQDNKIYIYSTRLNKPTEGQSIEVIKKDPQDNLKQAINKQILKGYSAADCILLPHKLSFLPASFTAVSMDVPRAADEEFDLSIAEQKAEKCPKYIGINGLEYFLEDTKHPDRMFFLRIGQYGITADSSDPNNIKAWQDTIEVY